MDTPAVYSSAEPTPLHGTTWGADLTALLTHLGRQFHRKDLRGHLSAYLTGLLSPIPQKNGWQLAEQAGEATPYVRYPTPAWTGQMGCRRRPR